MIEQIKELTKWAKNEKGLNQQECDDFIVYCQERGMFSNSEAKWDKIPYTKKNRERLFKENISPAPKRTAKLLGFTYKELAEQIGYTECGLKNAISKNKISDQLKKTLELLQENIELKNKLEIQNTKINDLKNYFKNFFLDF